MSDQHFFILLGICTVVGLVLMFATLSGMYMFFKMKDQKNGILR